MKGNTIKNIRMSIVIVSYNCLEYLKKCIESIYKFNDIENELEIIVVDNSPNDDIVKWINENYKEITAISNENKGFGYGNNVGSAIAKGDILLFLNPDTIIIEPIFKYAIEKFEEDKKLGLFGVELQDENGNFNSSFGLRMPLGFFKTLLCNILVKLKIFIASKMYTSGADIFIRKNVFLEAGKFDDNIFMYCEEADLCNRVNKIGYKNDYCRDKHIIHLEGKTESSNLSTFYERQMKSRKYYCNKYGINYAKELKKELRYCSFKYRVSDLLGKKKLSQQYKNIVSFLRKELNSI